jgi:hypothetical protein
MMKYVNWDNQIRSISYSENLLPEVMEKAYRKMWIENESHIPSTFNYEHNIL